MPIAARSLELHRLVVFEQLEQLELDDIYTLVEHLTDATRSQRRLELLDGMRASLSTAMDGF